MPYKKNEDVSYPGDYAIWAFNLCAEAISTMPKAKTELPKVEPTGRRAAIAAQKARKNAGR
ncbi:hypothetical protein LCGC14_0244300 [marine sediment metagenome]|uniref:Uncharacterized protein n=1 Tax=marine sediment metagenome TaxID=412755 RepID=A0A0F9XB27_9ZZZZ